MEKRDNIAALTREEWNLLDQHRLPWHSWHIGLSSFLGGGWLGGGAFCASWDGLQHSCPTSQMPATTSPQSWPAVTAGRSADQPHVPTGRRCRLHCPGGHSARLPPETLLCDRLFCVHAEQSCMSTAANMCHPDGKIFQRDFFKQGKVGLKQGYTAADRTSCIVWRQNLEVINKSNIYWNPEALPVI